MKKIITAFCLICLYLGTFVGCTVKEKASDAGNFRSKYTFPSYYTEYLDAKINHINFNKTQRKIDASFVFITDLHWDFNSRNSAALAEYVCDHTGIDNIILGGDYTSLDNEEVEVPSNIMRAVADNFNFGTVYPILGNHDTNINNGGATPFIEYTQSMSLISNGKVDSPYYSVVNGSFCYLFLNTNDLVKGNTQYNWLKSRLTEISEDKFVVIIMHEYYRTARDSESNPKFVPNNRGLAMEELLGDCADDIRCTVTGIFTGHIHRDYLTVNKFGINTVVTTCDGIDVLADEERGYRSRGTVTEQAFDVVQIDSTNRKVYLTRIGAGADREFSF